MNNLLEQVNGKKAPETLEKENCNVKPNGEIKIPVLKPVVQESITNNEIKISVLKPVVQEPITNGYNDVKTTNSVIKMPVLKPVMPVTVIEKKAESPYQAPPPPPPLKLPSSFYRDISSDEASSSSVPSSNFTSPSPSPLCHFNKSQSTENLGEIRKFEDESTSSSPVMFDRSTSLQTTPNSSESNLSEKSEVDVTVKRPIQRFRSNASTLPRKSEKLMMSHGKPNFVINKQHATMKSMKNKEKSPPVSDEFAIKVQELRKNFDTQSNTDNGRLVIKNGNGFLKTPNTSSSSSTISPPSSPISPPKLATKQHFTQFNLKSTSKFEQNIQPTLKSPVIQSFNTTNNNSNPVSPAPQKHRSEIQIPMMNNTQPTAPSSIPIATTYVPKATVPSYVQPTVNTSDEPNFEKKVCISFAKELSSAPNRYPDSAIVKKQNPSYISERNVILKELLAEDLMLKDIKFSIDPN